MGALHCRQRDGFYQAKKPAGAVSRYKKAIHEVRTFTQARFGAASAAILQGIDACAALTFVAVSYTTFQCTRRNRSGHDCSRYAAPLGSKRVLTAAYRGLLKDLVYALSRGKAPHSKTWERHSQVLYRMVYSGVGNAEAAPYISEVHSRLLKEAPRLLREAALAVAGAAKAADGGYFVHLQRFFLRQFEAWPKSRRRPSQGTPCSLQCPRLWRLMLAPSGVLAAQRALN